ncbi:MAG: TatD family hydrolase [Lachnospiraceae bacterium]|nr:TatD family hydrolase [Lachnospiraceae bacterium]MBR5583189.1 TatD family hydrolase [Lachnospiraceae bacterium]
MIFDTHAHYDDDAFDEDRDVLLSGMKDAGVEYIVNIGASMASSKRSVALAEKYPFMYAAVGVHPDEVGELDEEKFATLKEWAKHEKVKAIGEIGLDYYWDKEGHDLQKHWFLRQMELAHEMKLPMIVHSREAAKDTLDMVIAAKPLELSGIIHCYSYSVEQAREYLNMGYYIGIGGVLTFKNGKKLKEVAEYTPLSQIVLETDCPYLAPVPYRGKRNDSSKLSYVAEELAAIKQVSVEEVIRITTENGRKLYHI